MKILLTDKKQISSMTDMRVNRQGLSGIVFIFEISDYLGQITEYSAGKLLEFI